MKTGTAACVVLAVAAVGFAIHAGDLEPPGPPGPTMKTLQEVEPRTPIYASQLPLTITMPGSYYLVEDATGIAGSDGITIDAPDVTIDLRGFALIGVAGSGSGIQVNAGADRARVVNGTLRDWGNRGIRADAAAGAWVENVFAASNGSHGIHVANGATVRDCTADDNGFATNSDGIAAENQSLVTGCLVVNNARFGITVTNESFVVQCNATGNPAGNYNLAGSSGASNR